MTWITLFEDQFDTETADVPLEDHLPSVLGTGWIDEIRPGGSVYVDWDAGQLASPWWSGDEAVYLLVTDENPADDQAIETSHVTRANALLLRYSDTENGGSGYLGTYNGGNYHYQILRLDQGNETLLANVGPQNNHDNSVVIRLEAVGDSLRLYADGELKAEVQDNTYSGGLAGIQVRQSTGGFNFVRFQHDVDTTLGISPQSATLDIWSHAVDLVSSDRLTLQDTLHGLTNGPLQLTQGQALSPVRSTHSLSGQEPLLVSGEVLSPAGASHSHQVTVPLIGQDQFLQVDGALQSVFSLTVLVLLAASSAPARQIRPGARRKNEIIAGAGYRITPSSNRQMRF